MQVSEALQRRISIRQFLADPVDRQQVTQILDVARWSPSGGNLQPWRVIAVAGEARQAVIELAHKSLAPGAMELPEERPIYPPNLWEPYRSRRYKLGEDMYALLGIARTERDRRLGQWARNYEFFGAPVGLFFVIDQRFGHAQWAHLGMFMLSVALAAIERGLGSCMQEAWAAVRPQLKRHFGLAEEDMIYCGMSLGYPDLSAAVNQLRSERVAVDEFTSFRGFE
ncbi:MAG: nitroreductase [Sinobacteraceae bacterium]|nr:nitroreductase [Nevskiaceae bacterium]